MFTIHETKKIKSVSIEIMCGYLLYDKNKASLILPPIQMKQKILLNKLSNFGLSIILVRGGNFYFSTILRKNFERMYITSVHFSFFYKIKFTVCRKFKQSHLKLAFMSYLGGQLAHIPQQTHQLSKMWPSDFSTDCNVETLSCNKSKLYAKIWSISK